MMIPKTLLRKQFQNGYVVRNAEKAAAAIGKRFGITQWHFMPLDPSGPSTCNALAWAGDTMIELIEGNPRVESLYKAWIPESDDAARLHHFGFWVHSDEELKQAKTEFDLMGAKDVYSGDYGDILSFHYADTSPMLGHMCELIYLRPAGKDMFAPVPRN
jgi:hypothetical protein